MPESSEEFIEPEFGSYKKDESGKASKEKHPALLEKEKQEAESKKLGEELKQKTHFKETKKKKSKLPLIIFLILLLIGIVILITLTLIY